MSNASGLSASELAELRAEWIAELERRQSQWRAELTSTTEEHRQLLLRARMRDVGWELRCMRKLIVGKQPQLPDLLRQVYQAFSAKGGTLGEWARAHNMHRNAVVRSLSRPTGQMGHIIRQQLLNELGIPDPWRTV